MLKKLSLLLTIFSVFALLVPADSFANAGFNRLKAAGQGVSTGGGDDAEPGGGGSDGGKSGGGSGGGSGQPGTEPASHNDIIFLGVFETYIPTKRFNARMTVFAEPRKFLLGHRACQRTKRIRDQINQYFFNNPPQVDRRGRADTTGMDAGVRQAIKKALKTKLEYFTSIYVISGRYSTRSVPNELKEMGVTVTDCAGVIAAKKAMDEENK